MSTRDAETIHGENEMLRKELGLYKSVAVPFSGKPRTNLTRVRRMPLTARHDENLGLEKNSPEFDVLKYLPANDMTLDELA